MTGREICRTTALADGGEGVESDDEGTVVVLHVLNFVFDFKILNVSSL